MRIFNSWDAHSAHRPGGTGIPDRRNIMSTYIKNEEHFQSLNAAQAVIEPLIIFATWGLDPAPLFMPENKNEVEEAIPAQVKRFLAALRKSQSFDIADRVIVTSIGDNDGEGGKELADLSLEDFGIIAGGLFNSLHRPHIGRNYIYLGDNVVDECIDQLKARR